MKYIYKCNRCNYEMEKDLALNQVLNSAKAPKFHCPKCGGTTRKLINSVSIHYKGNGFYSTDNKKEVK